MSVDQSTVARWAEAVSAIARTGLAFNETPYDNERYEELMLIAGDMLSAVDGPDGMGAEEFVAGWRATMARGVSGYVTPKVGVGAYVGNERGELLLIQRSDNHRWFYPTGWADVGYSPAEVVIKEVMEECGVQVSPQRVISVLDGMRAGSPIPHYVLMFACDLVGGELKANPVECDDIGWFARDALPSPLHWADKWVDEAFAAISGEVKPTAFDAPREPVWRMLPG